MNYQLSQPVLLAAGTVILIIILALVFQRSIDRQLHAWKLLPQPERLTELYFTDPNHLPAKYVPGQTQTVRFTTHNLEYQTTDYHYKILETNQSTGQSQILATGDFNLPQNNYHNTSVNISTVDLGPDVKVEVMLSNVNESIDYLLQRGTA